jgi:hypothetical protein
MSAILVVGPKNPPVCSQAFGETHLETLHLLLVDERPLLTAGSRTSQD